MSYPQEKWPVEIFRFSATRGWELYQQPQPFTAGRECSKNNDNHNKKKDNNGKANSSSSGNGVDGGKVSSSGAGGTNSTTTTTNHLKSSQNYYNPYDDDDEGVTVAPRYGCVEVKKLRLRIHLFEKSNKNSRSTITSSQNTNHKSSRRNNKKAEAHTTVVRRRDRILLSSRRGLGAVVLKFRNVSQCNAFSDRLVELNSDYVFSQTEDKAEQRPTKRVRIADSVDNGKGGGGRKGGNESSSSSSNEVKAAAGATLNEKNAKDRGKSTSQKNGRCRQSKEEGRNDIRSYIVRLLHDGDFLDFVDSIENTLESTPDCSQMLKALEYPRRKQR